MMLQREHEQSSLSQSESSAVWSEATILLVDDEPGVLTALMRLLRREKKYRCFAAPSGAEALVLLEQHSIDLVISDMKMPGMSGAEFLAQVARRNTDVMRVLLTGFSDMESTICAINEGKIHSYLTKPWNNDQLLQTLEQALTARKLAQEKAQMLDLTRSQNDQLSRFSAELESQVAARTQELDLAQRRLEHSHSALQMHHDTAMEVLCRAAELSAGVGVGHCKRVAELAKNIAMEMQLPSAEVDQVYYAGLLHDVGKIHFPQGRNLSPRQSALQRAVTIEHSVLGEALLLPLDHYLPVSLLVRHHHERYDGSGFPDQLSGSRIPIGAAILAVAEDFDEACYGGLLTELLSVNEARQMIIDASGEAYHPEVVTAFKELQHTNSGECEAGVAGVHCSGLRPGMVLARDLLRGDGLLLLTHDTQINAVHIEKICQNEYLKGAQGVIWIKREVDELKVVESI